MVSLYAFVAHMGAAIAACISAMFGLSFLSVVGYAVLGANTAVLVLALVVYVIRS
jgi:roadblock/LC7 domain-containing protein